MSEEVKLYASAKDRESLDSLGDLYSILVATEALEKAYLRDAISAQEYTPACLRLIAQFKTIVNLLQGTDVRSFIAEYKISCVAAEKRLLEIGVPATVEHGASNTGGSSNTSNAKHVAETVQVFITLMDSLKLNLLAVDQLHPQLSDLIQALHRVSLSSALQGSKDRIRDWLIALNKRKASDEISQEESRQLLFDLEGAYSEFQDSLSNG